MTWTVLSVAYPLAAVGLDAVGGAEQVLTMLDRALTQAGHRSIVIAPEGSQVFGEHVPIPPVPGQIDEAARNAAHAATRQAIAKACLEFPIDLIHLHGIDFMDYLPPQGVPVLATLHLPLPWYPPAALHPDRPRTYLHCVSRSQHNSAPANAALLAPIPNGVDLNQFRPRGRKRGYAMLLARICPEKGIDIALRVSRQASLPLLIGGQLYPYPAHQEFFNLQVLPLLDSCRRYLGPLGMERKSALLPAAKCLLIPSLAPETSSLAAMEALACGTPVIAFRTGALPDIVEHGKTGYLADTEAEMLTALHTVHQLSPAQCREDAVERFGQARTIAAYFDRYCQLISQNVL